MQRCYGFFFICLSNDFLSSAQSARGALARVCTLGSQLRWCAPQPPLSKPMISQAEHPTSAQSGPCVHFRQGYQLFYFCFVTLLLTDLSAFNSLWHLYGHIKIPKPLEAIFRHRQGFLSSQSGVETGHHGFHGGHGTVVSRVGALGHTITSSLFVFLPSPHSFHSLYVKKGVSSLLFHG